MTVRRAGERGTDLSPRSIRRERISRGWVEAVVTGDRDPRYGSTSKMIAESALWLVRDVQSEGGTWTPGSLMGPALRKRLTERAGLTFSAR